MDSNQLDSSPLQVPRVQAVIEHILQRNKTKYTYNESTSTGKFLLILRSIKLNQTSD